MPAMTKLPASKTLVLQSQNRPRRLGFWSAILLALLAVTAFALGITTPPRSGPYCTGNCIVYPFTDAAQFVPRDYNWVIPAIFLVPVFVVVVACIHPFVQPGKRHLSLVGLCFSSIAASIIAIDYFIQFQVAEPSLLRGETAGLALFTQYNPHGLFIALEDLGYLALCVAFVLWVLRSPVRRDCTHNSMDPPGGRLSWIWLFYRDDLAFWIGARVPVRGRDHHRRMDCPGRPWGDACSFLPAATI